MQVISSFSLVMKSTHSQKNYMFRAIGLILVLWYISHLFTQSFAALDTAGKATFEAIEAAAIASKQNFE